MESFRNTPSKMLSARKAVTRLGVFKPKDLVNAGYTREYLRRLVAEGSVRKLEHGVYTAASFEGDQHQSLVEACKRFPRAVVCLMSALQFHEIGTQAPFQIWLAIPTEMKQPPTSTTLRFCKFSTASHSFGIQKQKLPGGIIPVYTPAKTVADCFKFRNKYGLDVATEALKSGWKEKKFTLAELKEAAAVCRVSKVIQPYLEMLT